MSRFGPASHPLMLKHDNGRDLMASRPVPLVSRALTVLRSALGWDQKELARAIGKSSSYVSDLERGQRTLTRGKLEELGRVMGAPPEAVEWAVSFVQAVDAVSRAPGYPDDLARTQRLQVEAIATDTGRLTTDFTRSLLNRLLDHGSALTVRQRA